MDIIKTEQTQMNPLLRFKKKFEDRVFYASPDGCHYWMGHTNELGYGQFHTTGKQHKAHRLSYILYKDDIPNGLFVCHSCDNPRCVNPHHLYLGTHTDNMNDMKSKGRGAVGSRHGKSKLSEKQVLEIRLLLKSKKHSQQAIGKIFGVSQTMIGFIHRNKNWTNV